jgi:hypothetical protein
VTIEETLGSGESSGNALAMQAKVAYRASAILVFDLKGFELSTESIIEPG